MAKEKTMAEKIEFLNRELNSELNELNRSEQRRAYLMDIVIGLNMAKEKFALLDGLNAEIVKAKQTLESVMAQVATTMAKRDGVASEVRKMEKDLAKKTEDLVALDEKIVAANEHIARGDRAAEMLNQLRVQ